MSEDEKFMLTRQQLHELMDIADKRTQGMFETFVGIMRSAVEEYPNGDLYEFLANQALLFVQCVVDGKMIGIDDPGKYFADCGFDDEKIEVLVKVFEATKEIVQRMDAGEQLMLWGADK